MERCPEILLPMCFLGGKIRPPTQMRKTLIVVSVIVFVAVGLWLLYREKYEAKDNPSQHILGEKTEQLNLALVKAGGKFGFIDRKGKYAVNPQFDDARSFTDGL